MENLVLIEEGNGTARVRRPSPVLVKLEEPQRIPSVKSKVRIEAIDFARGIAIMLMILSHGIKGLLSFEQFPSWGLVPIHLITKFSSTLFILVFGIALAVTQLPAVGTPAWPAKRRKLLLRGLVVLFWYKVLTIVELLPQYSREEVLDTLLYKSFPVYVEILGFYALALLWIPFVLPIWKKTPSIIQLAAPVALAGFSIWLSSQWNFFNSDALRAILVEHEKFYTWGQLSRGPLVFLGLILGAWILKFHPRSFGRWWVAGAFSLAGLALLGGFYWLAHEQLQSELLAIAKNVGKHPPERNFMLFSMGGAFLVLALSFAGGSLLARIFRPITIVGKDSLQSFIFHIFVIFVFYRYLLNYWQVINYNQALELTLLLMGLTAVWVKVVHWIKEKS